MIAIRNTLPYVLVPPLYKLYGKAVNGKAAYEETASISKF